MRIGICLLLPRTVGHGGFFELSVAGADCRIEAAVGWQGRHLPELGIGWRHEGGDLLGDGRTPGKARPVRLGARLAVAAGTAPAAYVEDGDAGWRVAGDGGRLALALCATIHGGMEPGDPDAARARDLDALARGRADGSLRRDNAARWRAVWARGFDVSVLPAEHRQLVLAQQYYLLASCDPSPWPTGPQGIAGNHWGGRPMWDNDLWVFRALLPLWPEFAETMLAARLRQLPEGRKTAAAMGCRGAFLGLTDEDGTDTGHPLYQQEVHLTAWPAFGVWDLWRKTGDAAVLRRYWPLVRETAEFIVSRCVRDPDGTWHLRGVVPPDEYVCEHGRGSCDDSVTTNLLFRQVLRQAHESAVLLGEPADAAWLAVGEGLHLAGPDAHGIVPEFAGYAGETIKQADATLTFYPLGRPLPPEVVRRNLDYYRERCDPFGPLMTSQIDACVLMRLGEREEGLRLLMEKYRRHVRGAFLVPTEGPHNNVAGFITAYGGMLQALVYGWTEYRQPGDDPGLIPRLGENWTEERP